MTLDADSTHSSRSRFITAARDLFLRNGYDGTSTASIAREAGSAESQMMRLFGGKVGLLEAVFNESWRPLNERLLFLAEETGSGREAILKFLATMISAFDREPDLAFLMLLEERRVRGERGGEVRISRGLSEFCGLVQRMIERGQRDGSLWATLDASALCSALMGAAEGMIRDRAIARREGRADSFSRASMRAVFDVMLGSVSGDS